MKAGELQRAMFFLRFLLGHVIMTLHTQTVDQTRWRLVSSLGYLKFSACLEG